MPAELTTQRNIVPSPSRTDLRAETLRSLECGAVYLPGDPEYDAARLPWNVAVDQRPVAVAVPRTVDEVSAIVRAAAAAGLRVAPQSTGHNAGPLAQDGQLDDVVVLRTGALDDVSIDRGASTLRVGGGALWQSAVAAAAPHGLAVLHGSSPDVGIAGYTLGGGIGWYARQYGLAANSLSAVELVIGDGTLVRASATENPELFWALRGGGGSFGVVTALELRTFPVRSAYAGMLVWDVTALERVLPAYAEWAASAPDEVTTSLRALNLPPLPELPAPIRGRRLVAVDGAVLGDDEHGERVIAALRALGPELDTFGRVPAVALSRLHMDPEGPTPAVSAHTVLEELPHSAIDAYVAQVGPDARTALLSAELRQLGGALARPHVGGGVMSTLPGAFAVFGVAVAPTPDAALAGRADALRLTEALTPWSSSRPYLNFAEVPVDTRTAYDDAVWLQLKGIRSAVDPHGVFLANHPVPRLYEDGRPTA